MRSPSNEHGEQGAKDRDEIDKEARPVGADQFDPARVSELRDDGGKDGDIGNDQPALQRHASHDRRASPPSPVENAI